jgi:hypothetical protein
VSTRQDQAGQASTSEQQQPNARASLPTSPEAGDHACLERATGADALHGPGINAKLSGDHPHARPARNRQSRTDAFFKLGSDRRPANMLSFTLGPRHASTFAIYWNNHHHLLHTVAHVDGLILWANSHLLFWLSLIPAATAWLGENFLAPIPTAVYGASLLMPAIAYNLLQKAILRRHGAHSVLATALGIDIKGKLSLILYAAGIAVAFLNPWLSIAIYALITVIWLVPDRRIERILRES